MPVYTIGCPSRLPGLEENKARLERLARRPCHITLKDDPEVRPYTTAIAFFDTSQCDNGDHGLRPSRSKTEEVRSNL